jgi:hypothetical protein
MGYLNHIGVALQCVPHLHLLLRMETSSVSCRIDLELRFLLQILPKANVLCFHLLLGLHLLDWLSLLHPKMTFDPMVEHSL